MTAAAHPLDRRRRASQLRSQREQEEAALAETRALIDALRRDKITAFESIGRAYAEYELAKAETAAEYLETKPHRALTAADVVRTKDTSLGRLAGG